MINKYQMKEEEQILTNQNKEIIFDSYLVNDIKDCNNFKKIKK